MSVHAVPRLTPAECDRQHALLSNDLVERYGVFATPGVELSSACARALDREEWRLFNKALGWSVAFTDWHCHSRIDTDGKPLPDGIFMPDRAGPGEVFLVYASADGKGFSFGGLVHLDEFAQASLADAAEPERVRRARKLEIANAIRAEIRRGAAEDTARMRALTNEMAALLLGEDEIEALYDVTDALPAVIVLTRVATDRRSVHAQKITTTLPGRWLGTRVAAGRS